MSCEIYSVILGFVDVFFQAELWLLTQEKILAEYSRCGLCGAGGSLFSCTCNGRFHILHTAPGWNQSPTDEQLTQPCGEESRPPTRGQCSTHPPEVTSHELILRPYMQCGLQENLSKRRVRGAAPEKAKIWARRAQIFRFPYTRGKSTKRSWRSAFGRRLFFF